MRSVQPSGAAQAAITPPIPSSNRAESVRELYATLNDCLAQLDAMNAHLAAAHLSSCLDVLNRDFNPD